MTRYRCAYLVKQPWFEKGVLWVVFVNVVLIAIDHSKTETVNGIRQGVGMDSTLEDVLDWCNIVFMCIFTLEITLGYIGFGKQYFSDALNRLDFIVVVLGWVEVIALPHCLHLFASLSVSQTVGMTVCLTAPFTVSLTVAFTVSFTASRNATLTCWFTVSGR